MTGKRMKFPIGWQESKVLQPPIDRISIPLGNMGVARADRIDGVLNAAADFSTIRSRRIGVRLKLSRC